MHYDPTSKTNAKAVARSLDPAKKQQQQDLYFLHMTTIRTRKSKYRANVSPPKKPRENNPVPLLHMNNFINYA
jgi:hypothetical protein